MLKKLFTAIILLFFVISVYSQEEARLLRHPHISGDMIVFVYAGDIYSVSAKGGNAVKLTSFEGFEVFPKISPDGRWIAFSGEYAGTRQIYVIPSTGGKPKQVTNYPDVGNMPPRGGWDNLPYDWTADSKKILVRSNRAEFGERIGKYFLVDPFSESLETPLKLNEGGPATLSPDGKKIAYSIQSREFRTWKRYKAGYAMDVYVFDLLKDTIEKITPYEGTDNFPMWIGNKIYFNSDRKDVDSDEPRTLNIYSYDISTKKTTKITKFTEFDVMFPARGGEQIVFENGGYIYRLDAKTDKFEKLTIKISDDKKLTRPMVQYVGDQIESFDISPNGKRVVVGARGEIFTLPAESGNTVNISNTPVNRETNVKWSPDGKYISYLSEKTGSYELYIQEYNSSKEPIQITKNTGHWIMSYNWSPDSKKILVSDKNNSLTYYEIDSKKSVFVDRGIFEELSDNDWSPDNKWITYSKSGDNRISSIWVYSIEQNKKYQLTGDIYNDSNPLFSKDGKYLTFVSRRDFNFGNRTFDAKLFIAPLTKDLLNPFVYINDDEDKASNNSKEEKPVSKKEETKTNDLNIKIDTDNFEQRIYAYPLPIGRYFRLNAVNDGILYLKDGSLFKFEMKTRKEVQMMERVFNYSLTADNKKFVYRSGNDYGIANLQPAQKALTGKLNLANMNLRIDPLVEWKQIYTDSWRIMRDWFYEPDMHKVDWKKMHDKYLPLVDHLAHRKDLDYIIGELIGELNAGHAYVESGDEDRIKREPIGLLGCEFEPAGEFYKISKIYQGENWNETLRSPLTEAGIKINEGEYLIAIDNNIIKTNDNPFKYLFNKVKIEVTLLVNDKPSREGAREIKVTTIESEVELRHYQWVLNNRKIVDELSGGKIGYIYVPNTGFEGFREFYKGWFSQFNKEGLIIDDRYNGGGSIPQPMASDMAQIPLNYWARRNLPLYSTPFFTHSGPKVMLINGRSSSGGDAFPTYFKKLGLGPLMGQKTWGGLIGYSPSPSFVDGGRLAVPMFSFVNTEGEWDVEYYGVEPDVEIFDDPSLIIKGRQPMIEKAVEHILQELKKNPVKKITKPDGPDRK